MSCGNYTASVQASTLYDALISDWANRAVSNGGAPSAATLSAMSTFITGLKGAGYYAKMKSMNVIAPDDLRCAMTPLIKHSTDGGFWQTCATSTGATTIFNSAAGALDAQGIHCNVAWTPCFSNQNFNPLAVFSSASNGGITVYETANPGGGPIAELVGSENAGGTQSVFVAENYFGNTYFDWLSDGTQMVIGASFYGYYSWNCTGANARAIYQASSLHPHALRLSSAAAVGGALTSLLIAFNGSNQNGTCNWTSSRTSFYALHDGLTITESADFFTRIQALRVAFGTGFL